MLPEIADYKDTGYVLWVGGCQYIAYLVNWLREHPIKKQLKILTDCSNDRARIAAMLYAKEIGIDLRLPKGVTEIAGCEIYQWNERTQHDMMAECRAALDIKMTNQFNQYHKPPTKAQKFVASGIPFAINPESYSAEYFRNRGFDVCSPMNHNRWLSRAYWDEQKKFAEKLRKITSIEAVGQRYRELLNKV